MQSFDTPSTHAPSVKTLPPGGLMTDQRRKQIAADTAVRMRERTDCMPRSCQTSSTADLRFRTTTRGVLTYATVQQ